MKLHHLLIVSVLVIAAQTLTPIPQAAAQVQSKTAEESIKEQKNRSAEREKKIAAEQQAKEDHHKKIQSKKTRRRMKRNRKKSERLAMGRSLPFYKRWFRRKRFK